MKSRPVHTFTAQNTEFPDRSSVRLEFTASGDEPHPVSARKSRVLRSERVYGSTSYATDRSCPKWHGKTTGREQSRHWRPRSSSRTTRSARRATTRWPEYGTCSRRAARGRRSKPRRSRHYGVSSNPMRRRNASKTHAGSRRMRTATTFCRGPSTAPAHCVFWQATCTARGKREKRRARTGYRTCRKGPDLEPRERLVLPEPGRSLFERTIGILNRHFPQGRRSAGFILGGGTLPGGRRGPIRRIHDVDVKVSPHPDHRILSRLYLSVA